MGFLGGLLKIMLEYKAGPCELVDAIISSPVGHIEPEIKYSDNYNNSDGLNNIPKKTCTECGGTGEDKERYESMFDVYAPCSKCYGLGEVPLE